MRTLTYGRRLPEDTDPGEIWFDALEYNIERDDAHNHDGDNSPRLTSVVSSLPSTQAIASADWVALGGGTGLYYQDVVLPLILGVQLQFDDVSMEFRLTATGGLVYPDIVKQSATSYRITVNDNSIDITAYMTT